MRIPCIRPRTALHHSALAVFASVLLLAGCGDSFPTFEDAAVSADTGSDTGSLGDTGGDAGGDTADAAGDAVQDVATDAADIGGDGGDVGTDTDDTGGDTGGDGDDTGGPLCPGGVDCACTQDSDCSSGICSTNSAGDKVCRAACTEQKDCADGLVCSALGDKKACVEAGLSENAPCESGDACTIGDATGVCASFGAEGFFCRPSCTEATDCDGESTCVDTALQDGKSAKVCMPKASGAPACSLYAAAIAASTTCYAPGLPGCTATRACETGDAPTLQACAPAAPVDETCNGADDDCDGQADDGTLCDDGNGCTTDTCKGKDGCSNDANTDPCDDGNACTKDDTCALSLCAGVTVTCDDGNACTDDACDMATGCTTTDNTDACDDGDACTKDDNCAVGLCTGATIDCDDGNLCTDDACDPKSGCTNADNAAPCDDGDACTKDDACALSLCGGVTVTCDDNDACTDDACDPKSGCTYSKNTAPCDDGDACTEQDTCDGLGSCKGSAVDCEDGNVCTDDPCDSKTGCAAKKLTTKPCDDGNACTKDDVCDGKGNCAANPVDCEDGNACTDDPCDPQSGCGPKENTTKPCDDGNACTVKDQCDGNGKCTATPLDCEDGDQCTDDPCDPKIGCAPKKMNTKPCDDPANCKANGVCDGKGNCTNLIDSCDDNNPCTADVCKTGKGCDYTPTNQNGACDDGDPCTESDACAAGTCKGAAKDCDDGNVCTDDACDKGACVNLANTATCTDNDVCTGGDVCSGSKCQPGKVWVCEDGLQCTDDPCDPVKGCLLKKLTTKTCDDGNPCTSKSQCDGKGNCLGTELKVCDDGNPCTLDTCIKGAGCTAIPVPVGTPCTDDNLCTENTACTAEAKCGGGTDNTGKACDDGNPCTVKDTCVPEKGCTGGVLDNCSATAFGVPFTETFVCDGGSAALWKGLEPAAGKLGWRIDGLPAPPGKKAPDCSLNFNDDTSFAANCSGKVGPATVAGPTLDFTSAKLPALSLKVSGSWETVSECAGPDGACDWLEIWVAEVIDGKAQTPVVLQRPKSPGTSTWLAVDVDLKAYAGKKVQLGFTFAADDCIENSGTGPFIDDIMVVDSACTAGASCDDGNSCTDDACDSKTGACLHINNDAQKCEDGDLCTGPDSCSAGKCVSGKPIVCADADLCTTNESCNPKDGTCVIGGKVDCNDGDVCTADACNGKTGLCSHTPIAGCKPTCKTDADCEDPGLCQTVACVDNTCSYKAANEGALCAASALCTNGTCAAQTKGWAKRIDSNPAGRTYCVLRHDGKVACWGANDQGQAGVANSKANVLKPTIVAGVENVVQLSVGDDHTCALDKGGKVWCWGDDASGQLGDNGSTDQDKPVEATQITDAVYVTAGGDYTCWITKAATVKCLGLGSSGRLGNGSTSSSKTPVDVKDLTGVIAIEAQYYFTCALKSDRTMWCWGYNFDKQLDPGVSSTVSTPVMRKEAKAVSLVDGGYASACWVSGGLVWCVGDNSDGQLGTGNTTDSATPILAKGPTNVLLAPSGGDHALALTTGGVLWGVGKNFYGQLAIADTDDQTAWLKTGFPSGLLDADGSDEATCAITAKGTVLCSGYNIDGQLGNGTNVNSTTPVSVLDFCSVDADCDDGDPCTSNACTAGQCEYKASSGAVCNDGDACTGKDVCADGKCAGVPVVCDDNDACTIGESCAVVSGLPVCLAGTDKLCDDGLPCTADSCDAKTGACSFLPIKGCFIGCKADKACDDGNACTADSCNVLTGACSYAPTNDGGVCGLGGTCNSGTCAPMSKGWAKSIKGNSYGYFFCAQTQKDALACWGRNDQGQLGAASSATSSNQPLLVEGIVGVKAYDAGTDHACAIDKDDKLWCWGDGLNYALGTGANTTDSNKPVAVTAVKAATDVCAGDGYTCVVKPDGTMACWGDNLYGQLGNGSTTDSAAAVDVKDLAEVVAIDCDNNAVCAVTSAGQLYCWGDNGDKEIDAAQSTYVTTPHLMATNLVQVFGSGYDTNCWNVGGALYCKGDNFAGQLGNGTTTDSSDPVLVKGPSAAIKVTGGYDHMVILAGDGSVWSAGENIDGQIGDGTTTDSKAWFKGPWKTSVDVAAAYGTTCGLDTLGQVHCVGNNFYGQAGATGTADQPALVMVPPVCTTNAECSDGDLCTTDTCDAKTGICSYKALDCDDGNACTLGEACDGKLGVCIKGTPVDCDDNNECTLDTCDTKTGLCSHAPIKGCVPSCKVDSDCPDKGYCNEVKCVLSKCVYTPVHTGDVCEEGKTCNAGVCAASGKGWAATLHATPGSQHLCATTVKGELACWGRNDQGQLGNNGTSNLSSPYIVQGIGKPIDVALGQDHSCVLNDAGKMFCWGDNFYGQLGDGTTTDRKTPVEAKAAGDFVDIEAGNNLTCGRKADGTLWCWGYGSSGRLGNGSTSNQSTPVQVKGATGVETWAYTYDAGYYLSGKGQIQAWGYNFYRQVANLSTSTVSEPTPFTGITDPVIWVGGGKYFGCAKITDTKYACWGDNSDGQLGNGTSSTSYSATPQYFTINDGTKGGPSVVGFWGGDDHNLALTRKGEVYCSGDNGNRACMDGTTTDVKGFKKIDFGATIVMVRGAADATCALDVNGLVWCGGDGYYKQLGNGASGTTDESTPQKVLDPYAP